MSRSARIFCLLFILAFLQSVSSSAWAVTKAGINIGDHYNEFPQAARSLGDGSWIYVMGCPGDVKQIFQYASLPEFAGKNLMIRGHYPDVPLTPEFARAWVASLGDIPNEQFPNKVYFMPINEPNHPPWAPDHMLIPDVIAYINELSSALKTSSLRGSRVKLLSPMIDLFYYYDELNAEKEEDRHDWVGELLSVAGDDFFSQFDGITVNLYGQYSGDLPDSEAPDIKKGRGYKKFISEHFAVTGKPFYAAETGVIKTSDGEVKYRENINQIIHYYGSWAGPVQTIDGQTGWAGDTNFRMFSIFSYNPHGDLSPWIYGESGVLSTMNGVSGGNKPEPAQPIDEGKFKAWREGIEVDPNSFNCGGAKKRRSSIIDTTMTGKTNSDTVDLEYQRAIWERGSINLGTVLLKNKGDSGQVTSLATEDEIYRFESYDTISKRTRMASRALLPGEIQDNMIEPSDSETQLPGQPTYRVCEVTDKDGNPLDVEVKTKGGFSFDTPPEYGKGLYFGNFLQAIIAPNQSAYPDEQLIKPAKLTEEERNKPLPACIDKQGRSKEGIKDPVAFEKKTVVVPVKSGVGDFFKGLVCKIPRLCQTIRIRLEATHFLAGAQTYHNEFTNPASGFVNTQLPVKPHQDDSLVTQQIEASNQLPVPQPDDRRGSIPESEVKGISLSGKEIGVPWGASIRDGFDNMLCSFMPSEFMPKEKCQISQSGSVSPENCMDTAAVFRRLDAVPQADCKNVKFTWEPVEGASKYKVDFQPIRIGADGKPVDNDADWQPKPDHWVTEEEDILNLGDSFDGRYKEFWWRVLAMDACNKQKRALDSGSSANAPGFDDRGIIRLQCQ